MMRDMHPMDQLALADPKIAEEVAGRLSRHDTDLPFWASLAEDTIWGLSVETSFGKEIALGYVYLWNRSCSTVSTLKQYRSMVRAFGEKGPTVGRIMARHLPVVLACDDNTLLSRYLKAFEVMYQKGTYTLKGPFEYLRTVLTAGDRAAGSAFLTLLCDAFSQSMPFNQSMHLTYMLPKAADTFQPSKRCFQIQELSRVIQVDIGLGETFLDGLQKGLHLLSGANLHRFVSDSLERYRQDPLMGARFLSLSSALALEICSALQVAVPLSQVRHQLNRYIRASTGSLISIEPVSKTLSDANRCDAGMPAVFSNGSTIYLPDELNVFDNQEDNVRLYHYLAKLEAGLYEFGTFEFDLEKALMRCGNSPADRAKDFSGDFQTAGGSNSELFRFLLRFPDRELAAALFTIFEHGRVAKLMAFHYPGLVKRLLPVFQKEAERLYLHSGHDDLLLALYARIALNTSLMSRQSRRENFRRWVLKTTLLFETEIRRNNSVETSAKLVSLTIESASRLLNESGSFLKAKPVLLSLPFGRALKADFLLDRHRPYDAVAASVAEKLKAMGIRVFRSDIRKKLVQKDGTISTQDVQDILSQTGGEGEPCSAENRDALNDTRLIKDASVTHEPDDGGTPVCGENDPAFQYPEWDCRLKDYLENHVRVRDRFFAETAGNFFEDTLQRNHGLVKRMRYAFELLKPEGLTLLRQWPEGDHFDYRALLDFAVDRRTGRLPDDRLYIKRVKKRRNVAVLVLVDLSRSTASKAAGANASVLDIEKEAIVLLSEALTVVGDRFAIAGFSGTGRLGVDYLRIKDFSESSSGGLKRRINALAPQRSTRMGAAIRHAVGELIKVTAPVRVLMTLGDGFPNDVGYKDAYAIADTRKAVQEAYAKQIHFKAITVNIAADPKLDELYGHLNHNVISDITELPDKLLRIYSAMTRM